MPMVFREIDPYCNKYSDILFQKYKIVEADEYIYDKR